MKAASKDISRKIPATTIQRPKRIVVPRTLKLVSSTQDVRSVLQATEISRPAPFHFAAPEMFDSRTIKLSEGSFGEIYKITKSDGEERILKIIPVEGVNPGHDGEAQLTFREIAPEVYTSVLNVVQDTFPQMTLDAWDAYYATEKHSDHPRPDLYHLNQAFVTIEQEVAGIELEYYRMNSYVQALSVFEQVAVSLAIAEDALSFEHRDLHVGNILVKPCYEQLLMDFRYRGQKLQIPTHGVQVKIIDFTFSRIETGEDVKYLALDKLYDVVRSSKFKFLNHRYVYGRMENLTKKNWRGYYPKTNIYWLKHIVEVLLDMIRRFRRRTAEEEFAKTALRIHNSLCLTYDSAAQFVRDCVLIN